MAKNKKPIQEMSDEEIQKYVFPKKVRDELMRIAHEKDDKEEDSESEKSSQ